MGLLEPDPEKESFRVQGIRKVNLNRYLACSFLS